MVAMPLTELERLSEAMVALAKANMKKATVRVSLARNMMGVQELSWTIDAEVTA